MNFMKYASLFLCIAGLALPGCASKKTTKAAQVENSQVEDRILASEQTAAEENPSKEDLSGGL